MVKLLKYRDHQNGLYAEHNQNRTGYARMKQANTKIMAFKNGKKKDRFKLLQGLDINSIKEEIINQIIYMLKALFNCICL